MLHLYHSNQVELLRQLLIEVAKVEPLQSPFESEKILVQSPGMSQWLKLGISERFGIAANIEFPLPATFIWNLFTQVLPNVPEQSAFNKNEMAWKIMAILPEHLNDDDFAPLKQYLAVDEQGTKLYQLAMLIADTFDGYLVYRPDWILAWEQDIHVTELEGKHPWQAKLWRALEKYNKKLGHSKYHRANLFDDFIKALAEGKVELAKLPTRLFVFGISSLPPRYLEVLKALGDHIDVHLFLTNPCQYYWGDIKDHKTINRLKSGKREHLEWKYDHSEVTDTTALLNEQQQAELALHDEQSNLVGNSLLASWGKLGRDNLTLLLELEPHELDAFVEPDRDTLLASVQRDILSLTENTDFQEINDSEHKRQIPLNDQSLSIHSCHSPMREVQVLHDNLLKMFAADPSLKPQDIIVMAVDINAYAPAIKTVFGNAKGEHYIPYSISDRSSLDENPIIAAFNEILTLPLSRCSNSQLMAILETPSILAKFDLTKAEFDVLQQWVDEAGVRWGLDSDTQVEDYLPTMAQNHWQFGLERMLFGYAMGAESELLDFDDYQISPLNEVQGSHAEAVGKLSLFVEKISSFNSQLKASQSVQSWQQLLGAMLEEFFIDDLDSQYSLELIRKSLTKLHTQVDNAGFEAELSPEVISQYLREQLGGEQVSQRFLAGQVNFCTPMPMRAIPFKKVCMLGLNEGAYPRNVTPIGFDMMPYTMRRGDRSRRIDDRYLFLEALLAAQETLYLSFIGRSAKDNSELMPSILVSELVEYCQQNFCLVGDQKLTPTQSAQHLRQHLSQQYPLSPYAEENFIIGSYDNRYVVEPLVPLQQQTLPSYLSSLALDEELPLAELQRFWRLPVAYFYQRRLQVNLATEQYQQLDDEPFVFDGLEGYAVKSLLLSETLLGQLNKQQLLGQLKATGMAPQGQMAVLEFERLHDEVDELASKLSERYQQPLDDIEINLDFSVEQFNFTLTGWLKHLVVIGEQKTLLRFKTGKIGVKELLAAWLDHLAACAMGHSINTEIIGIEKGEPAGIVLQALNPQIAHAELAVFVQYYFAGLDAPLAYFPQTSFKAFELSQKMKQELAQEPNNTELQQELSKDRLQQLAKTFHDDFSFSCDADDPNIHRAFGKWNDELAEQVIATALQVFGTIEQYQREWQ
ncbi:exodeoxyribonuclease V subunit gamma [Paraferrimonas sp. SM1919]|uniref:exodeoxyribonuclease V subunit gamma n=1 Tax=Paraferrimonas sp. SM1919 TaxID=2662263 RepID=UPI0013D01202|nr:exodeoxyribonuclease V subunit gamma [Paraferrimonas sp. SM1919]